MGGVGGGTGGVPIIVHNLVSRLADSDQAHSVAYGIPTVHKEAQCITVSLQGTSDNGEAAPTGFTDLLADIQQFDLLNWN